MGRAKVEKSSGGKKMRPALTPEARENQLIALAVDCAEEQLRNGTASSQVITHYLKLGSTREKLEKEIMEKKKELMDAQIKETESLGDIKEMMEKALDAFKGYRSSSDEEN